MPSGKHLIAAVVVVGALLMVALFGAGSARAIAALLLIGAFVGAAVRARTRRTYELPTELHLYAIALSPRSVSDGPARQTTFEDAVQHLSVRDPFLLAHLGEGAAIDDDDEGKDSGGEQREALVRYAFLVGIPHAWADAGHAALMNAYKGSGCIVRVVPMEESALYAAAYAAIERERAEREAAELARLEARSARASARASARDSARAQGHGSGHCRSLLGAYRHDHDDTRVTEGVPALTADDDDESGEVR